MREAADLLRIMLRTLAAAQFVRDAPAVDVHIVTQEPD
jgi:hypothetical protein